MTSIFVDTSAWAAMNNDKDKFYTRARDAITQFGKQFKWVTTNYVLDESYTLLLNDVGYARALAAKQVIDYLRKQNKLNIIWVDEQIAVEAWGIFEQFNRDKTWSFTDCVSYAVMKRERLTDVFAFDHHFEQMGFALLG